jgi:VanZ family protein
MIGILFTQRSPFKKPARVLASLWTLLIFIGCFAPSASLPKVDVPLADKWVHFLLFGGFTFFWALTRPLCTLRWLGSLFLLAVGLGIAIELLQGLLTFLGRSMEFMDAVADAIGGALGVAVFAVAYFFANRKTENQ